MPFNMVFFSVRQKVKQLATDSSGDLQAFPYIFYRTILLLKIFILFFTNVKLLRTTLQALRTTFLRSETVFPPSEAIFPSSASIFRCSEVLFLPSASISLNYFIKKSYSACISRKNRPVRSASKGMRSEEKWLRREEKGMRSKEKWLRREEKGMRSKKKRMPSAINWMPTAFSVYIHAIRRTNSSEPHQKGQRPYLMDNGQLIILLSPYLL